MKKIAALIISVLIALSGIFCVFAENGSFEEKTLFHIASEQVSHNEHLAFEGKLFSAGVTAELIGAVFVSVPKYSAMTVTSLSDGIEMYNDHKKLSEGSAEMIYAFSLGGDLSYCISGHKTDGEYVAKVTDKDYVADKITQLLKQPAEQMVNGNKVKIDNIYFLAPDSSSLLMICETESGITAKAYSGDKYYEFTEEEYAKAYADYMEYRRRVSAENGGQEVVGGKNLFDVHELVLSGEFDPNSLYISPVARKLLVAVIALVVIGATVSSIFLLRRKRATPTEAEE